VLVAFFLTVALLIPSIANAQIAQFLVQNPTISPAPTSTATLQTPEFSLKFIPVFYNVTNANTGASQQIDNSSIEFIIKNQPLPVNTADNSNVSLFYQLRAKNHYSQDWSEIDSIQILQQSNSDCTVFTIPLHDPPFFPWINYQVLDFQVQAILYIYSDIYNPNLQNFPGMPSGGYVITYTPVLQPSDWSNTQTITINGTSTSPNPTPTPDTTSTIPEFSGFVILLLLVSMIFAAFEVRHQRQPV